MTRIAQRAGVAVQTVYFVFHTKGELLTVVPSVTRVPMEGTRREPG